LLGYLGSAEEFVLQRRLGPPETDAIGNDDEVDGTTPVERVERGPSDPENPDPACIGLIRI
jgi:hypothetical protein